jgi:hypothetical protein
MQKDKLKNNCSIQVPKNMGPKFEAITKLTDDVCHAHLNDEYAQLSREVTAALSRKRPSPIASGSAKCWACGIVYALGFVNFLFDKNTEPYLNATQLCDAFHVSKSVGGTKSKQIKNSLDMYQMAPKWCLPSMVDQNPMAWMIMVDGFIVDARRASKELQVIAFEKGLIPYVPE